MDVLRKYLQGEGHIEKKDLLRLFTLVTRMHKKDPNVATMQEPIFVIGDTHGQFYDMIHMFEKAIDGLNLNETSLLFLGDYVDRGAYGVEIIIFLYALKLNYPKTVVLLRGNHETALQTEMYTFREEVLEKYNDDEMVYLAFLETFNALPIAATINGDYLALHGGISPDIKKIDDINAIDRFVEPPLESMISDILWSDPVKDVKEAKGLKYEENDARGCAYRFGL